MEAFPSQNRQQWEQPFDSHENLSLTRRRGAIIDTLSVKNGAQLFHSDSHYIDITLDAPGSQDIERRCHFGDGETLKEVLTRVTEDYGVDLSKCQVVSISQPEMLLDFNCLATDVSCQSFLIMSSSRHLSVVLRPVSDCALKLSTVDDCIAYFNGHGLKPLDGTACDNAFSLKELAPIGFKSWEDLLDQETIEDFTEEEEDQQEALWELIYTEHSHLTQLAVVINVFMKSLEYMQSIDLLTEVNYHNIFGHMRDLYEVHKNFWNLTLLPCLQKAVDDCRPFDVNDFIMHFPQQFNELFEPYENHCIFEFQNLQALDDAMNNADFNTYIKWCEARPECNRLRLKDFLAKPMQRLTKYPLLLKAILTKTSSCESRVKLQNIIATVNNFVGKINSALRYQDEVEKVKVVSQRLATTCIVRDVPSGWEKYLQPYLQLDLLAPMPGINLQQPRTLVMEGALRYKEDTIKLDANVFLFTDMLLITKATKKSPDQLVIVKTPYKIDSLIAKPGKDPTVVDLVCLNDLKLVSIIFSLKATTPQIATSWLENIQHAQQIYYQLRCSYESQVQPQQSPVIWSALSQHTGSFSESGYYSQSVSSMCEPSIGRQDSCRSVNSNKLRLSTSLSPPVTVSTTKDSSTQTDDAVETSSSSQPGSPNKELPAKQISFAKTTVKRCVSCDGLERDSVLKLDENSLSFSGSARNDTLVNNRSAVQKHKRSKSLKLTRNKK